jgi:hypothetical protein
MCGKRRRRHRFSAFWLIGKLPFLDCGQSLGFFGKLFLQKTFLVLVILCSYRGALLVLPCLGRSLVLLWSCLGLGLALVLVLPWSWFGPGLAVVLVLPWSWSCLGPVQSSFASPNLLLVFASVSFCVHHKFIVVLFYIYI